MEQNRRISGQTGVSLSVVNTVLGNCLHKHRHTNTHEKIPSSTHHPPLKLSVSSIRCRCVCVSVCKGDADSDSQQQPPKTGGEDSDPGGKVKRKHFSPPARTAAPKQTGGYFSKFVFFFLLLLFHRQSPREADECGKMRDSSVRAGLLEAGTGGEGA